MRNHVRKVCPMRNHVRKVCSMRNHVRKVCPMRNHVRKVCSMRNHVHKNRNKNRNYRVTTIDLVLPGCQEVNHFSVEV